PVPAPLLRGVTTGAVDLLRGALFAAQRLRLEGLGAEIGRKVRGRIGLDGGKLAIVGRLSAGDLADGVRIVEGSHQEERALPVPAGEELPSRSDQSGIAELLDHLEPVRPARARGGGMPFARIGAFVA